jgi:hypothetical protein
LDVGSTAIPIIYTLFVITIPESPRWLISQSRVEEAKKVMKIISPDQDSELLATQMEEDYADAPKENIFMKKYRFPLTLAFLVAFFNQMSGINAFLYYAPRIFGEAGLGEKTALLSSIGIGVVNMVFTLVGVNLIDKVGEKTNVYWIHRIYYFSGISVYGILLSLVGFGDSNLPFPVHCISRDWSGNYNLGVYIGDFPESSPRIRTVVWKLYALGTRCNYPFAYPNPIFYHWPGTVFLVFTIAMVFQLLFVIFMMPETKGTTLEKLSKSLSK